MVANRRYGGDAPPYGQRDRKRPGDDFGHTGDRKRVNYNNNYKQERPSRVKEPTLHLATSPKGRPEYPVHQSPSSASPGSNASTRAGEIRSKYHLSIHILDLIALHGPHRNSGIGEKMYFSGVDSAYIFSSLTLSRSTFGMNT